MPLAIIVAGRDATNHGDGANTRPLILVDHLGKTALNAGTYFMGQDLRQVRCLRGSIHAWAQDMGPEMRRYKWARSCLP